MWQKEHVIHPMYSTVNHNGLMWRIIGSWWHWEQGHLVSTVWAIGLLLGLSIRESEELGRWVTQTDCLQMVAVEGSTRVPVKNPLLYPMGEGTDRQRGVPGPGESIRCVCMCEVNSRHLGVGKCRWTLNQKKQTCFISYAEFITYTNLLHLLHFLHKRLQ